MRTHDKHLIVHDKYLGKPAGPDDTIVKRRVGLVKRIPHFCDNKLTLVDIGCGNGASVLALSGVMKSCTGLEINAGHIQEFQKLKIAQGVKNTDVLLCDVEKNPPPRTFDRLISFELIEHLHDEASVAHFHKLLKPGGFAAISVPNKWWLFETHGARLPTIPVIPWYLTPFVSWLPRPLHERVAHARIYTKGRIKKLLRKQGFEVMDMYYITAPLDVIGEGQLKSLLARYIFSGKTTKIPFLSTSIFVIARKK